MGLKNNLLSITGSSLILLLSFLGVVLFYTSFLLFLRYESMADEVFFQCLFIIMGAVDIVELFLVVANDYFQRRTNSKNKFIFIFIISMIFLMTITLFYCFYIYSMILSLGLEIHSEIVSTNSFFNFFILIANIVLIIITGYSVYKTNKKSQHDLEEKNIHSNIEFYNMQLANYYLPLRNDLQKMLRLLCSIFDATSLKHNIPKESQLTNVKLIKRPIDSERLEFLYHRFGNKSAKLNHKIIEITMQYSAMNTVSINELMDHKTPFNLESSIILDPLQFLTRTAVNVRKDVSLENVINELLLKLDSLKDDKNDEKSINLNEFIKYFVSSCAVFSYAEQLHFNAFSDSWESIREEIFIELYNVNLNLINSEINSSVDTINEKITNEYDKLKNL